MQFLGVLLLMGLVMEILSIFLMANWIGGLATFGLMILSFLAGSALLRNMAGMSKLMMAGQILRGGGVSMYDLLFPVRIPFAGILLISPGFLSSIFAILLLIPFKGKPVQNQHQAFGGEGFQYTQYTSRSAQHDEDVIEGDFVVHSNNKQKKQQDVIEHRP